MKEDKKEIYKGFEISYSVYGENSEYSATGSAYLLSIGLIVSINGLNPPSQTLEDAEARFLRKIKKQVDYYLARKENL